MTTPETNLDSLLGAYALDAVDDLERIQIERYIATSPRARAEVDEHLQVAMMLGNSAGPAPLALWDRIDQKIQQGPSAPKESPAPFIPAQNSGPKRAGGSRISTGTRSPGAGITTGGTVVRRPSFGLSAAAAACVAAILAISTVTFSQSRRINELQATVTRTNLEAEQERSRANKERENAAKERERAAKDQRQIESLERELTNAGTPDARVTQLLSASSGRVVELVAGTAPVGRVVFDPATGEGFVIATDLQRLPDGRTYQLWGVQGDTVLSLGVLGQAPATRGFAADGSWSAFVLTEEASPGVASSKQPPLAVAQVVTA
jgi:hypothetical protein